MPTKPLPLEPFTLMVARFPGNNQEHPDSSGWVIEQAAKWQVDDRIKKVIPFKKSDTPITMVRNLCVKTALDHGADYLLMIDSDMAPDCEEGAPPFWDTAWRFMTDWREAENEAVFHDADFFYDDGHVFHPAHPPATIAAPYCGPPPLECCYVFDWVDAASHEPDQYVRLTMVDRLDAARRRGIQDAAALPTGLILYDTRVFRVLRPPWFCYEWGDDYQTHKVTTEDVYQTRNASLMGMPQFCAWDCWAGHVKPKTVRKPVPLTVDRVRDELAESLARKLAAAGKGSGPVGRLAGA